jgi:hypothetical protein
MADGFIVRKGGGSGEPTAIPTIRIVNITPTSVVFTVTNNSINTQNVTYGLTTPPTDETITLESNETSTNQTISSLDPEENYILFAQVTGSELSPIAQKQFITTPPFTDAFGGQVFEYDLDQKRYRSHTFFGNGILTFTNVGVSDDDRNKVDYLIIAGGGGGGSARGGGGGAGGFRTTLGTQGGNGTLDTKATVNLGNLSITVGAGGAGGSGGQNGISGGNSSVDFSTNIISLGGGGGSATGNGFPGGSGSGAQGRFLPAAVGVGGAGTANQGTNGGNAFNSNNSSEIASGGGGGAGVAGTNGTNSQGGKGGNGLDNLLRIGTNETRAGGGGGACRATLGQGGSGGGGAGGQGDGASIILPRPGINNTGSGGGGGMGSASSSGGSGMVVIRYEIAPTV